MTRKTKHDGLEYDELYDSPLCLKCGGNVVFLPTAKCGGCGFLKDHEYVKIREDLIPQAREAIWSAMYRLDEWEQHVKETEETRASDYPI